MELFEKVEKLKEKANVTYEEAKAALEEANGDMLDAMILLEKKGKTTSGSSESVAYSTKYEDNRELPSVVDIEESKETGNERKFTDKMAALWKKLCDNYLIVERKEEKIVKLPLWMFIAIVIVGIEIVPILIVISLFFGFRYQFAGKDEMKTANEAAKKAGEIAEEVAEKVKDEYNKL